MLEDIQFFLDQFKNFYEQKLLVIDQHNNKLSNEEILQMKLDVSRAYITDLAEQNLNLIQTSSLLQNETENRVKILEKLLEKTSQASKEYVQGVESFRFMFAEEKEKSTTDLSIVLREKLKSVENEKSVLKEHCGYLGKQISGLVQVINRARSTGCWDFAASELCVEDLEAFTPSEKLSSRFQTHSDDFNCRDSFLSDELCKSWTENSTSNRLNYHSYTSPSILTTSALNFQERNSLNGSYVTGKDVLIKRLQVDVKFLEKEVNAKNLQLLSKDGTIAALQSQIIELRQELLVKESDCELHSRILQQKLDEQRLKNLEVIRTTEQIEKLTKNVENKEIYKRNQLVNNSTQTDGTINKMAALENKDTQLKELEINSLRIKLREKEAEIEQLKREIGEYKELSKTKVEKNEKDLDLKIQFEDETENCKKEILKLKDDLRAADAGARETRFILSSEIAEKHDEIRNLREELLELNDHHKEVVQQMVLKNEVIKDLRRDLQTVETKFSEVNLELTNQKVRFLTQCELLDVQTTELENQKITIANLREALVQSKRGTGSASSGGSASNGSGGRRSSSVREVFDI